MLILNEPAFPSNEATKIPNVAPPGNKATVHYPGVTKLEHATLIAMQGLLSSDLGPVKSLSSTKTEDVKAAQEWIALQAKLIAMTVLMELSK